MQARDNRKSTSSQSHASSLPKFNEVRILKKKKKVEREKTLLSDFKLLMVESKLNLKFSFSSSTLGLGSLKKKTSSLEFVSLFFFFFSLLALLLLNIYLYCWNNI